MAGSTADRAGGGNDHGPIESALDGSTIYRLVTRLGDRLHEIITHSWIYRWLTAEPEPEVIVIDLRETYTVGPIIALLDRFIEALAPSVKRSRTARTTLAGWDRFEAAPLRMGGFALVIVGVLVLLTGATSGATGRLAVGALLLAGGAILMGDARSLEEVRDTRTYRFLASILEPPEPPEGEDEPRGEGVSSDDEPPLRDER